MTKIVGTIGPVSESPDMTQKLVDEGLRIMRINFSHAEHSEALQRIHNLRACRGVHSESQNTFNLRAVLLDTKGPEIRTGKMKNGKKVLLETGKEILLTNNKEFQEQGTAERIYITYPHLVDTVKSGDTVLLSDGLIRLNAIHVDKAKNEIRCVIQNTEELGNTKGVNLPGLQVNLPALSEKDKIDLMFGVQHDVDFIAASFIRKPSDVIEIREFVQSQMSKHWPSDHPAPKIISKIENLEGIQNFDQILEVSDGIMVARGDLGVEVPLQKVLTYQKLMVEKCNAIGKPVIVATQMLESMIQNPRPTRAEVSDVGNAVLDGADAVMLSGECANGKYPVDSVRTMMTVIKEADQLLETQYHEYEWTPAENDVESVASSVVKTAHEMNAKLMIVLTDTGRTAQMIAKYRPTVPVMCFTPSCKIGRQLQIHRGLYPVVPANQTSRPTAAEAIKEAKRMGWLVSKDRVVLLSSDSLSDDLGRQVVMRVAEVA
ncbi:unnamed protein product [Albugo candida]|uniref:Pyruvate kinase n=1 Tax=Albugo candida TaxID=65357 RepID=A0A024GUE7_9STRA|nr:unnamed protein product [Albugo candida]|eukprot:CCI50362.1 unnamed protein product [Albugo candida]